ncbi:proline-rich extensin-like protein EPR1, partial [Aphis craccivora]
APKLLWITIIHVLLWNFIFSVTESIEVNGAEDLLLKNSFRDRVRYSTHICDRLKNSPPPLVAYHNNEELLSSSDSDVNLENPGLTKDLTKGVNLVKRHVSLRCYNHHTQENNEPNNQDPSVTSEWQMKSTPVNDAFDADFSAVQKPKVVDLKKIDINLHKVIHQEPLHSAIPQLQKGNLIGENSKYSLPQLNLQDETNKIKSLISVPQHKYADIKPDQLFNGNLHKKLVLPSLTFPLPSKFIKSPIPHSLSRPTQIHNTYVDTAVLTTENYQQSDPSKLTPHNIPNKNVYQKDSIVEKKPGLSLSSIQINKPKPLEVPDDKRVPPIAYRPTSPHYIQIPEIKPLLIPIFVRKVVTISPQSERPQANIDLLSHSKIIKNGITESTAQPILIEKEVPVSLQHKNNSGLIDWFLSKNDLKTTGAKWPHKPVKKQQELIDLSSSTQLIKTPDAEIVHKPTTIEKEVSISESNSQKQPIIDLSSQTPQFVNIPDKESLYQTTPGQPILPINAPYEQKQSIINLPPLSQVTETVAPLELINSFNPKLISQKKSTLYDQQEPIILPSPPPLIKTTTTSAYAIEY